MQYYNKLKVLGIVHLQHGNCKDFRRNSREKGSLISHPSTMHGTYGAGRALRGHRDSQQTILSVIPASSSDRRERAREALAFHLPLTPCQITLFLRIPRDERSELGSGLRMNPIVSKFWSKPKTSLISAWLAITKLVQSTIENA